MQYPWTPEERVIYPELELQVIVSKQEETKLWASVRAVSALNSWAISLAPQYTVLNGNQN